MERFSELFEVGHYGFPPNKRPRFWPAGRRRMRNVCAEHRADGIHVASVPRLSFSAELGDGWRIARATPEGDRAENQQDADHDQRQEDEAGEGQVATRADGRDPVAGIDPEGPVGVAAPAARVGVAAPATARLDVLANLGVRSAWADPHAGKRDGRNRSRRQQDHRQNYWNALQHACSLPLVLASRHLNLRVDSAGLSATLIPLLLIVYLGLTNGGFDPVSRSVVGIFVWWIVLVGTAVNLLPAAGGTVAGRLLFVLAAAFAAWTALAFMWTDSDERTATELARVSTYLGVFALALAAQGTGRWRQVLNGITAGVVVVCGIALLSRMHPGWFPEQIAGRYLQEIEIESRLAYPINYSSGLGALAAIGLPLALAATSSARSTAGQALAAAALPILALTLWLTTSSLSVPAAAVALAVFVVLAPDRLPKLATLLVAGAGSAILFLATEGREAFDRGLLTPAAENEGSEMLAITLAVCGGVALVQIGFSRLGRGVDRPAWLQISRRHATIATAAVVATTAAVAVAAGAPGELEDRWEAFKSRGASVIPEQASRGDEILDFSGSGRYDFWEAAVDANATQPLLGIGPGTWDFWWLGHGSYAAYVRDAHSLYLETLAELGIVGFVLITVFSAGVLLTGAWRALRAPPEARLAIAAATAGSAAFVAGALVDWMWELGALAVVFFALAAVACGAREDAPVRGERAGSRWRREGGRVAVVAVALAGLVAIVPPLWGTVALQRSYEAAADERLGDALGEARNAISAQPYAASPRIQEARLLARQGDLDGAASAAREATEREPTNWQHWLFLSRVAARTGDSDQAARARRRAERLNPRSSVFAP